MSLAPGDRVVVAPNVSCGQCSSCRRGLRNHCENFTTHGVFIDGGLAPQVVVPASQCFPIGHQALKEMGYRGTVGLEAYASGDDNVALERFSAVFGAGTSAQQQPSDD